MVAHSKRVGDGERRTHRADGDGEARVDQAEVVDRVLPAVDVEDRGGRVGAEPGRIVLMGRRGDVHPIAQADAALAGLLVESEAGIESNFLHGRFRASVFVRAPLSANSRTK